MALLRLCFSQAAVPSLCDRPSSSTAADVPLEASTSVHLLAFNHQSSSRQSSVFPRPRTANSPPLPSRLAYHNTGQRICQANYMASYVDEGRTRPKQDDGEARGIPTAPIQPGAFTPEGLPRVLPQTNPPDDHQLNTPCSIRPKTASTSRVPASVSSLDKGTRLPSARLGFRSQRATFSRSPNTSSALAIKCANR